MKRFVLITVVPVVIAFGAGISVGSALMSISSASSRMAASGVSPEALQGSIDARALPVTQVGDFN
jgi:hypothetical protein